MAAADKPETSVLEEAVRGDRRVLDLVAGARVSTLVLADDRTKEGSASAAKEETLLLEAAKEETSAEDNKVPGLASIWAVETLALEEETLEMALGAEVVKEETLVLADVKVERSDWGEEVLVLGIRAAKTKLDMWELALVEVKPVKVETPALADARPREE